VSVISTKLDGMKEHIIIKAGHTMIASNKKTLKLSLAFLKNGTFG
jgi:hypothetical protein